MRKKIVLGAAILVLLVAVSMILGFMSNAYRVVTVTVTLLDGQEDPKDITLPFDPEAAPDYRLQLRYSDGWVDCGTFQNREMGTGLTWQVPEDAPPASFLVEYKLLESDRGFDDILEQVPVDSDLVQGNAFQFDRTTEYSSRAGWAWFFAHPIGIAMVAAMALAALLLVASIIPG